jgi:uncharacterized protein YecE (DUF72 family)
MAKRDWLDHYARHFDTAEINNTFYSLPSKDTLKDWHDRVPDSFVFTAKMSRYLTHMKKLNDPAEPVDRFMDAVSPLGDKLRVILVQLPPNWKAVPDRLDQALQVMGDRYRIAVECRDPSWWSDEVADVLRRNEAGFCLYDMAGEGPPEIVTSDLVYCRLHGPDANYAGGYDGRTLNGWARRIDRWMGEGREVFVFFDNDDRGHAPQDAQRLKAQCDDLAA